MVVSDIFVVFTVTVAIARVVRVVMVLIVVLNLIKLVKRIRSSKLGQCFGRRRGLGFSVAGVRVGVGC